MINKIDEVLFSIDCFKVHYDELIENGSDTSQELEIDLIRLLQDLGEILENLTISDFKKINKKIIKNKDYIKYISKESDLSGKHPDRMKRIDQMVSTVFNITTRNCFSEEILDSKIYHGNALNYGLIALSKLELNPDTMPSPQQFALDYARNQLRNAYNNEEGDVPDVYYLLRPSSSKVGIVTLSYFLPSTMEFLHYRLPIRSEESGLLEEIDLFFHKKGLEAQKPVPELSKTDTKIYVRDVYA